MWDVIFDPEFADWLAGLRPDVRRAIFNKLALIREWGPQLGRPHVETLKGMLANLKELRVQHRGRPWRLIFAFDPVRRAVVLVGGDKGRDDRWFKTFIPIAEERYRRHLERME